MTKTAKTTKRTSTAAKAWATRSQSPTKVRASALKAWETRRAIAAFLAGR